MGTLPKHHYPAAVLRCVLPPCGETGEVGLGFNMPDGTVLRLRISGRQAKWLASSLVEGLLAPYGQVSQSANSSANPSVDVSTPPGAENVCPPTRSSSAAGAL